MDQNHTDLTLILHISWAHTCQKNDDDNDESDDEKKRVSENQK